MWWNKLWWNGYRYWSRIKNSSGVREAESRRVGSTSKIALSLKTNRVAPSPRSETVGASGKTEAGEGKTSPAGKKEWGESRTSLAGSFRKKESNKRAVSHRTTRAIKELTRK